MFSLKPAGLFIFLPTQKNETKKGAGDAIRLKLSLLES